MKRNCKKFMCLLMMLTLLLSGIHLPTVKAADTTPCPTIGKSENLVPSALNKDFTFNNSDKNCQWTTELSDVVGKTWYISQTLKFDTLSNNEFHDTAVAVTGTIGNSTEGTHIRVGVVPEKNEWRIAISPEPMWQYEGIETLYTTTSSVEIKAGQEYVLTIQVKNGNEVSFWFDGKCVVSGYVLEDYTDLRPAFGYREGGSSGTISNIQVWDEYTCPEIGKSENLVPADCKAGLTYDSDSKVMQALSAVQGDTWYIQQTLKFTKAPGNQWFETGVAVSGEVNNASANDIRVDVLPGGNQCRIVIGQEPIYNYFGGQAEITKTLSYKIEAEKEYVLTVRVKNGNELSVWMNGKRVIAGYVINGYTDLKPAYGFRGNGTAGTISNIQVWDEYTCPEIGKCENLAPADCKAGLTYDSDSKVMQALSAVQGDTWYIQQTLKFTKAPGNQWFETGVVVSGEVNNASANDIRVDVLPGGNQCRIVIGQEPIYNYFGGQAEITKTLSYKIEAEKEYVLTVRVKNGNELSVWINGNCVIAGHVIEGYTDLKPAYGFRGNGTAGTISNIQVWDGVTLKKDVVVELYADITGYRGETKTAPTKAGYVFAGWFTDADCTTAVTTETASVYAKFVTEDVLSVKAQLKAGTTAESATTDLRLVTTVDSLAYTRIGFVITKGEKTTSTVGTQVYKTILAREGEGTIRYNDPKVFSDASVYFHTVSLLNIPRNEFATELTVSAYWITQDGTTVTGPARTLSVNIGLAATTEG